jgi:uncharacterized protein YerC
MPRTAKKAQDSALSADQLRAALMLANGESQVAIAEKIGVNPCTISRWSRHNNDFRAKVNEFLLDIENSMKNRLRALSFDALATVEEIMHNPSHRAEDRLKAAKIILDRLEPKPEQIGPVTAQEIERADQREALISEWF